MLEQDPSFGAGNVEINLLSTLAPLSHNNMTSAFCSRIPTAEDQFTLTLLPINLGSINQWLMDDETGGIKPDLRSSERGPHCLNGALAGIPTDFVYGCIGNLTPCVLYHLNTLASRLCKTIQETHWCRQHLSYRH